MAVKREQVQTCKNVPIIQHPHMTGAGLGGDSNTTAQTTRSSGLFHPALGSDYLMMFVRAASATSNVLTSEGSHVTCRYSKPWMCMFEIRRKFMRDYNQNLVSDDKHQHINNIGYTCHEAAVSFLSSL